MLGLAIAAIAGAILGGASGAYQAHQQKKAAKQQAELQAQANAEQQRIAAGQAQQQTVTNPIQVDDTSKKSALIRSILTRNSSSSKFGD